MSILDEAVALAGVDPRALHAQLTAGQPDRTVQLARAFEDAGREARDAYQRGRRAHGMIADGFTNEDQQRKHDRNAEKAGKPKPWRLHIGLSLRQQFAERRRAGRQAEAKEIERGQRHHRR